MATRVRRNGAVRTGRLGRVLMLGTFAVLGCTAVLALGAGQQPSPPDALLPGSRTPVSDDEPSVPRGALDDPEPRFRRDAEAAPHVDMSSPCSASLPIPTATVEVFVRDAVTGRPVPGATVWTACDRAGPAARRGIATNTDSRIDRAPGADAPGSTGTTGPDGTVAVPRGPDARYAVATSGARRGFSRLDAQQPLAAQQPLVIELTASRDLVVRTQSVDGTAIADVPLSVRVSGAGPDFRGLGVTDADGTLRVTIGDGGDLPMHETLDFVARVDGAAAPTSIDGSTWPDRPLALVVPSLGKLRVLVRDGRGDAVADASVTLETANGAALARGRTADDGVLRFDALPVGRAAWLQITQFGVSHRVLVPGPTRPGTLAEAIVELAVEPDVWTGTVVDDLGSPRAHTALRLTFRTSTPATVDTVSDAEGRFRVALSPLPDLVSLESVSIDALDASGRFTWVGADRANVPRTGAATDLGPCRLARRSAVVAGTLALPRGCRAELVVEHQIAADAWVPAPGVGARPTRPGTFEFVGAVETAPLRLRVVTPDCVPVPPQPFTAGSTDVHLRLERGAKVVATFADLPAPEARLVAADGDVLAADRGDRRDARGLSTRTWSRLPAGRYRIEARTDAATDWSLLDTFTLDASDAGHTWERGPFDVDRLASARR